MSIKNWVLNLINIFHQVKDEKLNWQLANHADLARLKQAQALAEEALAAELRKRSVVLEHEVALLKTKQEAELNMYKTRCQQDIKDYQQYLSALDKLKSSIKKSYTHLPEAVAFTIHHHAKHLLNQMWECEDLHEKMRYEMQLLNFMTTVHEDAQLHLVGKNTEKLPERTLNLIKNQ
jgi:methanogenic corrinoid protein MtbC1